MTIQPVRPMRPKIPRTPPGFGWPGGGAEFVGVAGCAEFMLRNGWAGPCSLSCVCVCVRWHKSRRGDGDVSRGKLCLALGLCTVAAKLASSSSPACDREREKLASSPVCLPPNVCTRIGRSLLSTSDLAKVRPAPDPVLNTLNTRGRVGREHRRPVPGCSRPTGTGPGPCSTDRGRPTPQRRALPTGPSR